MENAPNLTSARRACSPLGPNCDTLPPHDDIAEAAALGCILGARTPDEARGRLADLAEADMYDHRHREIRSALVHLAEAGKPLDVPTVYASLREAGKLDEAGGLAYVNSLPDSVPSPEGWNSWLEVVRDFRQRRTDLAESARLRARALAGGTTDGRSDETDGGVFSRLSKLSRPDYDRVRVAEAERLRIRVATLDAEVENRRPKTADDVELQGRVLDLPDIEPWPDPVDGTELLDEILSTVRRFVIASDAALSASALFDLHTYAFDLGDVSPILFITGPMLRCGKTHLLSVLARMVNRPLTAGSASAAGIYRTIELHRPTLLIDEVDRFVSTNEELCGLLNCGHTRDAAFHLGCVTRGDDFEPRRWSLWTPKIFSGIGRLTSTLEDRSIIVTMTRRRKDEAIERFRQKTQFEDLRRKCARFVADHTETIRAADPAVPDALNDRAADNWTPLLVLADLAGGHWPETARRAALQLSGDDATQTLDIREQLLQDVKNVFSEAQADRLSSKDLCDRLAKIEGRPWAEFGKRHEPISKNQLAYQLRHLNIASRAVRIGDLTPRGYSIDDFTDAFSRYLAGNPFSKCNNATMPASIEQNPLFRNATPEPCCVSENATSTNNDGPCCIVADRKAVNVGKGGNSEETATEKAVVRTPIAVPSAPPAVVAKKTGWPDVYVPPDADLVKDLTAKLRRRIAERERQPQLEL